MIVKNAPDGLLITFQTRNGMPVFVTTEVFFIAFDPKDFNNELYGHFYVDPNWEEEKINENLQTLTGIQWISKEELQNFNYGWVHFGEGDSE